MGLLRIDNAPLIELVAHWLAQKENYQWLDFGGGRQIVTPPLLKIMLQRPSHLVRAYTNDTGKPIGVVALNNVDLVFRTGTLWGAAGDKAFRNRGYATAAAAALLTLAFRELGLHAINTWAVEHNPSRRAIERLGFRRMGRLRQAHCIDGRFYDRVFYDLLAAEHEEERARFRTDSSERPRRRTDSPTIVRNGFGSRKSSTA